MRGNPRHGRGGNWAGSYGPGESSSRGGGSDPQKGCNGRGDSYRGGCYHRGDYYFAGRAASAEIESFVLIATMTANAAILVKVAKIPIAAKAEIPVKGTITVKDLSRQLLLSRWMC